MKAVSGHYRTILLAALLAGCTPTDPPEAALRAWLADAEAAAEVRDRDALLEMVSERYLDAEGNDREALGQKLRLYLLRHRHIAIVSRIEELTITGGTAARVVVSAAMAGSGESALDLDADARRFELELELEGDDWRLIGARWDGT
jgi:hypothetical protein